MGNPVIISQSGAEREDEKWQACSFYNNSTERTQGVIGE
jgi:hypothetical protein